MKQVSLVETDRTLRARSSGDKGHRPKHMSAAEQKEEKRSDSQQLSVEAFDLLDVDAKYDFIENAFPDSYVQWTKSGIPTGIACYPSWFDDAQELYDAIAPVAKCPIERVDGRLRFNEEFILLLDTLCNADGSKKYNWKLEEEFLLLQEHRVFHWAEQRLSKPDAKFPCSLDVVGLQGKSLEAVAEHVEYVQKNALIGPSFDFHDFERRVKCFGNWAYFYTQLLSENSGQLDGEVGICPSGLSLSDLHAVCRATQYVYQKATSVLPDYHGAVYPSASLVQELPNTIDAEWDVIQQILHYEVKQGIFRHHDLIGCFRGCMVIVNLPSEADGWPTESGRPSFEFGATSTQSAEVAFTMLLDPGDMLVIDDESIGDVYLFHAILGRLMFQRRVAVVIRRCVAKGLVVAPRRN